MVKMRVEYQGDKHCTLTHEPSGSTIETDAPRDNGGRGERFSPTDLLAAALASCAVTTMAIVAEREGIPFSGAQAEIAKEMAGDPRRVAALPLTIQMPGALTAAQRQRLEEVAHGCPVARSLHPDVKRTIEFVYPD